MRLRLDKPGKPLSTEELQRMVIAREILGSNLR